jgi:hypothetical protein
VAVAWLILFVVLTALQRQLLYVPTGDVGSPAQAGLRDVAVEPLVAPDGTSLAVWSAPARPGQPTILFFHGNSGTLFYRSHYFGDFRARGWGLFAMSWRGYSGTTGSPSEAANVADALLAYDTLVGRGIDGRDVIVVGESLGTGVAIQVAAQRRVGAVVLDSPYSSITDVASHHYWYLPVRLVLRDRYESTRHVQAVTAPILILHGRADSVIPIRFAERLRDAIPPAQVRFVAYPGVQHGGPVLHGGFAAIAAFVADVRGQAP